MPAVALDAVREMARVIDRPFAPEDIDPMLLEAAEQYATEYRGRFPFMIEMQARLARAQQYGDTFTPAQAKAVLNCLRADVRRQDATPAAPPAPITPVVPDGRYTVQAEGIEGHVTLMLKKPRGDYEEGIQTASFRRGDEWVRFAFVRGDRVALFRAFREGFERQRAALDILLQRGAWQSFGQAYARRSRRCFICGRELTEPQSLDIGVGPDCRGRAGV